MPGPLPKVSKEPWYLPKTKALPPAVMPPPPAAPARPGNFRAPAGAEDAAENGGRHRLAAHN
eukprot:3573184-Lingulodinium_polyedra.AAC.1